MEKRTSGEVLATVQSEGCDFVDLRFCDLPGIMQHVTIPADVLSEGTFVDGHGFDGSSIRGFQQIQESDMILIPDPETAYIDPFMQHKTLVIHCFVADPVTGESYSRDPRYIASKAEAYMTSTGIADAGVLRARARVLHLRRRALRLSAEQGVPHGRLDRGHLEHRPRRGPEPRLQAAHQAGLLPRAADGPLPGPALGDGGEPRRRSASTSSCTTTRSPPPVRARSARRFNTLLAMGDQLMTFKYVLKRTAHAAGKTLTFMPKPVFQDNGSGMHTHQSLWKDGQPLFFSETGYAGLSDIARWYIGGLLHHAPAILAFAAPTTNSYKRLVPGYEAPVNLVYSQRNRSAACRIPLAQKSPKAKRVEFRCPDSSGNAYLSFSAMLMAGLDGVQNRIEPPPPVDKDLYDLPPEELAKVPQVPSSLDESLKALEDDNAFLTAGGVFTHDLIETHIEYKRENEIDALRLRPHPYEFALYYDI